MIRDPIPIIVTTTEIVKRVMAGEKMLIPAIQFNQFLYETDVGMLDCKINCVQVGAMVELTRWD